MTNDKKETTLTDLDKALSLALQEGELTLFDEEGERYVIKHQRKHKPVDIEELRKWRVKMPGITSDELVESVHEMRAAGYN